MCIYCELWGEGKVWYLNPKNYARQMYTVNPPTSKPRPPRGEADPNSLTKSYKAIVDAMTVGPEALEAATNVIRSGAATGEEGPVGGWWGQVVPLMDAERMVEIANPLGLLGCVCRLHYLALEEQNEEEFTCIGLGVGMLKWERWPERYKRGVHWVSSQEAKEWLRKLDRKGFVHTLMLFGSRFIGGICNCDYPVCDSISQRLDLGYGLLKGHHVAVVNEEVCNGCGVCVQRCQFGAIKFNVTTDKTNIDQFRCFGCGLCETGCPRQAIRLEEREKIASLEEVW